MIVFWEKIYLNAVCYPFFSNRIFEKWLFWGVWRPQVRADFALKNHLPHHCSGEELQWACIKNGIQARPQWTIPGQVAMSGLCPWTSSCKWPFNWKSAQVTMSMHHLTTHSVPIPTDTEPMKIALVKLSLEEKDCCQRFGLWDPIVLFLSKCSPEYTLSPQEYTLFMLMQSPNSHKVPWCPVTIQWSHGNEVI